MAGIYYRACRQFAQNLDADPKVQELLKINGIRAFFFQFQNHINDVYKNVVIKTPGYTYWEMNKHWDDYYLMFSVQMDWNTEKVPPSLKYDAKRSMQQYFEESYQIALRN